MTPALTVEATAERAAEPAHERAVERPAEGQPAGPCPDDRQTQLISLVRERNAAGTARQLESWVHRRGLASLQAFRQAAVPDLLSEADDAWLEGCLHQPLERRLANEALARDPLSCAGVDSLAGPDPGAAAGPEQPMGMETSPTGQGSIQTQQDGVVQVASPKPPLPFPSNEQFASAGLASDDEAGSHQQALEELWPDATFNAEINPGINPEIGLASGTAIAETGFATGCVEANPELRALDRSAELGSRDRLDGVARDQEGVAATATGPAAGAELGAGPEDQAEVTSAAQSGPSQPPGLERGLSAPGAVLVDVPQRLRRKLVGSFGKARVLMRACFEEAISTLHPHGDADQNVTEPLESAAAAAEGSAGAPDPLASSWPSLNSPAAATAQPASPVSLPTATSAPIGAGPSWVAPPGADAGGADGTGAAPLAAWSRSLASSLPTASLDVPLQGPPAPAPAHLADLRAWLPGSSGQDRRAS